MLIPNYNNHSINNNSEEQKEETSYYEQFVKDIGRGVFAILKTSFLKMLTVLQLPELIVKVDQYYCYLKILLKNNLTFHKQSNFI